MIYPEDAVVDDPVKRPPADPLMITRFERFSDGGAERRLLEDWLSGSSKAAQDWVDSVNASRDLLELREAKKRSLTAQDMNYFRGHLGIQDGDIRKTFSSRGVEPEVLKTLFGDPIDYDVKPCSDDSLIYLLRQDHIDILIGMCHLSTHSIPLDSLNSFDITAAAKVAYDSYDSISPSQSLK